MAKKKQEDPPKGSPAWMATFSDLMNLLLCFFVLLFSMSTVDAEKFQMVVASLQSSFNVLPNSGTAIREGELISSGLSSLDVFDVYFNSSSQLPEGSQQPSDAYEVPEDISPKQAQEVLTTEGLKESEQMAEQIEKQLESYGLTEQVELEYTEHYVMLNLNGALLFEAGETEVRPDALPVVDKLCVILEKYADRLIEVEGHTDNVPVTNEWYGSNEVLSTYRAIFVANYIRAHTNILPAQVKASGRGEYAPIADNSTPEGRARNRRVEIKIYNSLYTEELQ